MNRTHLFNSAKSALVATLTVALLGLASYVALEPLASRAAIDIFEVTQQITGELAFNASTTDVTMSPAIPGVTGGTADGNTQVIITTNNAAGYTMTIEFSTGTPMVGEDTDQVINNYTPVAAVVPDYTFGIGGAGTPGEFAYSAYASTSGDLDVTFQDTGAACGSGGGSTSGTCWFNASTTDGSTPIAETIINRGSATEASGSTSTIQFRVGVPSNPSPALPVDFYTATATLTAVAT